MRSLRASGRIFRREGVETGPKRVRVEAGTRGEVQWDFGADRGTNGVGNGLKPPKLIRSKTDCRIAKEIAGRAPNIRFHGGIIGFQITTVSGYFLDLV